MLVSLGGDPNLAPEDSSYQWYWVLYTELRLTCNKLHLGNHGVVIIVRYRKHQWKAIIQANL